MANILVTGADGQLGMEIRKIARTCRDCRFVFTDISTLDITSRDAVISRVEKERPDFIVNCAGFTMVDRAEEEKEKALLINGYAVANLVEAIEGYGGHLVQISTDYVLDGGYHKPYPEDYPAVPLSVYGRSKLIGEEMALASGKSMVIRTSWLYSVYGSNFVKTILRLARERDNLRIVNDQTGSPTWAADLASAIIVIIRRHLSGGQPFEKGIYNYSNEGQCTWYQFAAEINNYLALGRTIEPIGTEEYPLPAMRPSYSVLNKDKIRKQYGIFIPGWSDSLHRCLDIIKSIKNE